MRLTLNTFDDASKEIKILKNDKAEVKSSKSTFSKINFVSSKYTDMDCFEVAKGLIQSTIIQEFDDIGRKNSETNHKVEYETNRCQTAKNTIFEINDTLMLLVVLAACALNMIFQSGLAVFHGK